MKTLLFSFFCLTNLWSLESSKIINVDSKFSVLQLNHGSFDGIKEGITRTFLTAPDPLDGHSYIVAKGQAIKVFQIIAIGIF